MKDYIYNADVGTFEIRQVEHELYQLWLGDEMLGEYATAEMAADDVANLNTGIPEWDALEPGDETVPTSLDDWAEVKEEIPEA